MIKILYKTTMITLSKVSPVMASRLIYFRYTKRHLNLKKPKSFNEKLMKIKLDNYIHNKNVWACADKFTVREYAKKKGVNEVNLPKLIGVYESADDIDFNKLPTKFALKCTHGAGFNIICTDKSKLDFHLTRAKLSKWLETNFGLETAETHYSKVKPRIICEEFIENNSGELPVDYKIYCFNGNPLYIMTCTEREESLRLKMFDLEWGDTGYIKDSYLTNKVLAAPKTLQSMLEMASKVSKDFPFVRVDFYEDRGVAVLGEMTFTPYANVINYITDEGQDELGSLLS